MGQDPKFQIPNPKLQIKPLCEFWDFARFFALYYYLNTG
jgi:hypothetical protein